MAKKNNQNKKKPPSAHDLFSMLSLDRAWRVLYALAAHIHKPAHGT
jgi:hypothetical protein